jgi:D-amino-acid dehydrogenase
VQTKVAIIGGGVIGVLTAYFLSKKGFTVEVFEKRMGVAGGASLANGSQISFSHIYPIYFENNGLKAVFKSKQKFDSVLKSGEVKKSILDLQKESIHHINKHIKNFSELAFISKEALDEVVKNEKLELYIKNSGILHLFKNKAEAMNEVEHAKLYGQPFRMLSMQETCQIEPNVSNFEAKFNFSVYYEQDKTSNCHDICKILEGILKERGVVFNFKSEVKRLHSEGEKITSLELEDGSEVKADYFVCANGTDLPSLASTVELEFNIFPVRGYSYTFNMEKSNYAPFVGLIDRERKMVYSLYKNYLRVAGFFDIGVEEPSLIASRMKDFEDTIFDVFPLLKRNGIVHKWTENRPFTPDSLPIIGKSSPFSNLLINGGHGALGFTLSFGSAKIISELI